MCGRGLHRRSRLVCSCCVSSLVAAAAGAGAAWAVAAVAAAVVVGWETVTGPLTP